VLVDPCGGFYFGSEFSEVVPAAIRPQNFRAPDAAPHHWRQNSTHTNPHKPIMRRSVGLASISSVRERSRLAAVVRQDDRHAARNPPSRSRQHPPPFFTITHPQSEKNVGKQFVRRFLSASAR